MDAIAAARSMRGSVGMLAMHWLMCPSTPKKATAAGLPEGIAGYAVGRLGVLGNCPVDDLVTAAFFWEPEYMRTQATAGRAVKSPHEGAAVYVRLCQEWGTQHLDDFEGNQRLSELAERVVNSASPNGAPTFAGWRGQTLPDTGPARTMQLMQTMRELGFARHCSAVHAAAMSPVEAIMSGPTGAWNARFFGWPEPYPDGEPLRAARNEIEAESNRRHSADFEVLTDDERDEFVALAKGARNYAGERITPETGAALPS
jgi:hypothetical protein